MTAERFDHRSLLLPNGDVLVLGTLGQDALAPEEAVAAEVYDVSNNRWITLPFPVGGAALRAPEAVLTSRGEVVVESPNLSRAFVLGLDREWRIVGEIPGSSGSGLVQLPTGDLMIPGAIRGIQSAIGNETAGEWREGPSFDFDTRSAATVQFPSGDTLVVGGHFNNESGVEVMLANAFLFDVASGEWRSAGRLTFPTDGYRLALLDEYRVIALPGSTAEETLSHIVEMFDVRDVANGCVTQALKPQALP